MKRLRKLGEGIFFVSIFLLVIMVNAKGVTAQQGTADSPLEKQYDVILIQKIDVPTKLAEDYPNAAAECESSAVTALQAKNIFQKVEMVQAGSKNKGNVLMIQPTVTSLRIVSGAARFWGGAFAGQSDMSVALKLVDASTGNTLREKTLSTANNPYAAAWTFGGNDRSMPSDMGKMIAEYISSIAAVK